jgi:uncharacterized membrane protein
MDINQLSEKRNAKPVVWIIYGLQFLALFTMGLSFLVAGFLAYTKYDENIGSMEESHLKWQIKTFWGVLIGLVTGILLMIILVGKIILLVTELWLLYRVVKGSIFLTQGRGVDTDGIF